MFNRKLKNASVTRPMAECGERGLDKILLEDIGMGEAAPTASQGKPEGKEEPRSNACNEKDQEE